MNTRRFLFSLKIFSPSVSIQNANVKKLYCIDHALVASVSPGILNNQGHLLENIIFLHIRRHASQIYYYRTSSGKEIDFIWLDGNRDRHLVQASWSIKDPLTRKREESALFQAMDELALPKATIVTRDEEDTISKHGKIISVIPAWKYLLFSEHGEGVFNIRGQSWWSGEKSRHPKIARFISDDVQEYGPSQMGDREALWPIMYFCKYKGRSLIIWLIWLITSPAEAGCGFWLTAHSW